MRPVVVVGAGLAGLCTALACAPRPVLLVGPDPRGDASSSALAQGGIAAAMGEGDSPGLHAGDTLAAGAHRNAPERVRELTESAVGTIAWLQSLGVRFDHRDGRLSLGREGGHGRARIVHAGGDRTGAVVVETLRARVREAGHVRWLDDARVDALLLRGGGVSGVRLASGRGAVVVESDAVCLATGGLGGLFARSTNPEGHLGHGLALAMAVGARLRDLEYVQFHPSALDVPRDGRLPLLTEALRGAGAVLRDADGRAVMRGVHPLRDLAPRDVVARQLWRLRDRGGAWLDLRALGQGLAARFPTVAETCAEHGLDPRTAPVPVTPAAHFHMGGVATDADGATTRPGLFAVGEVACNGVHGANRLASNSLLECVVLGRRLGARLRDAARPCARPHARASLVEPGHAPPAGELARLRSLMWEAAGPLRTRAGLGAALSALHGFDPTAAPVRVARALLVAARDNPRSAGAHWIAEVTGGG